MANNRVINPATTGTNNSTAMEQVACYPIDTNGDDITDANPVPISIQQPIDSLSGGVEISVQDQTTPPLDALFAQEVSSFTLASDTTASTITTLEYDFEATAGHGIIVGDELILLDVVGNRSLQAQATAVVGDTITLDRPIDHVYPAAISLGRVTTTNMAVDGSTTPQIFTLRAGSVPVDVVRYLITMLSANSMDDGKFGSLAALTNGLVLRIVNGFQKTIFCFKTNGEIKQFCYDLQYASKSAAGTNGLSARITFAGQDKHGVAMRISTGDVIQWVVQDDLTGMLNIQCSVQGHDTSM
jgi:hypothetical protein